MLDIFLTSSETEKDRGGTRRKYQSDWSHYGHLGSFGGRLKGHLRKGGDQRGGFLLLIGQNFVFLDAKLGH